MLNHDRLVPFIAIIAILEEILPLVIIYAPFLLPSTCILPSQQRRIETFADIKRWKALVSLEASLAATTIPRNVDRNEEGILDYLPGGSIPLLCR